MKKQFIAKLLALALVLSMEPGEADAAAAGLGGDLRVAAGAEHGGQSLVAEQVTGDELVLKIEAPGATKVDVSIPAKALSC